jgi:L-asparaginase II
VCGPHDPLSTRGQRVLRETGGFPARLHNNCSGKHAAMLARAATSGWPTDGYEREDHPVQRAALETVSRWSGLPASSIGRAVDGCGVPVFLSPLESIARAYARLAAAAARREETPRRVVDAMLAQPFRVGGTDRFDTVLMEESDGRILAKVGAEGVHALAVLDRGIGVALKVEDGAQRAQGASVLRLLQHLGALSDPLPPRLADFLRKSLRNTRGETVGELRPVA